MNDTTAAPLARDRARVEVREPLGERVLEAPLRIGAAGATVVVPDAHDADALELCWDGEQWLARGTQAGRRELRAGDVLAVGSARLVVTAMDAGPAAARLAIELRHLAGNPTIAPLAPPRAADEGDAAAEVEILATTLADGAQRQAASPSSQPAARPRLVLWSVFSLLGAVAAAVLLLLARVERVPLSVEPADADVGVEGLLAWASSDALFALPGPHRVVATRDGYEPLERELDVLAAEPGRVPSRLVLQLVKLPGRLVIDTGGVPASVTVDGAPVGEVPGEIDVPAGTRTLTLRSPRHLDLVEVVEVQGGGARQELTLKLQSAWGTVAVSARVPGARVSVDGAEPVALPASIDLPGGVHRLRISADGARDWESSVLVRAGQTVEVGPVELGAPDARLALRSVPSGADVTVAGEFRGRTPLQLALPAGAEYDLLVSRPGHRTWQRRVAAAPGASLAFDARLEPVLVALTVRGEPADAELFVDGVARGRTPATLDVLATRQRVEVRRSGLQNFVTDVDLTAGLARTIEYTLLPEGRPAGWRPPAASVTSRSGIALRLVQPGTFTMGSERREQGRRPNETARRVTLSRPFYVGVREVTNAEFRRFRAGHASGAVFGRSIDLDSQAVSNVGWDDAVAFCNWLSEQDGLPPAYERRDNRWVLRQPVGTGYRLPSEAEWEYAARLAGAALRRYGWGDALPVPAGYANLGGGESASSLPAVLDGYTDEHPVVAPVAKYVASPGGFHDLTGNVAEWVHDAYSSAPSAAAATDPFGPEGAATRRVIKGSHWRTAVFTELRLAWRDGAEAPADWIGFRVARYAE
jgi:formylglycine-generating enzyme required for sulfatase activity